MDHEQAEVKLVRSSAEVAEAVANNRVEATRKSRAPHPERWAISHGWRENMKFLQRLFGDKVKADSIHSTIVNENRIGCPKCGGLSYEHDGYFGDYTCVKCGWSTKIVPQGVNISRTTELRKTAPSDGCPKCGGLSYEHDGYFSDYTCVKCGWSTKTVPQGVDIIRITEHRKTAPSDRTINPIHGEDTKSTSVDTQVKNIPPWRKGEENPFSSDVRFQRSDLKFGCPTCQREMTVSLAAIDPIVGHHLQCPNCDNLSHIPGILREKRADLALIRGTISIKIAEFTDWYYAHPVFKSLIAAHESQLLQHYGLWAFCRGCYHEYASGALIALPHALDAKKYGGQFMFNAKTQQSAQDMDSLTARRCLTCGDTNILVIMASIPEAVRSAIKSWQGNR